MYTWHDNAFVYVDLYGFPYNDFEPSSFAPFCEYAASCEEQKDAHEDDASKAKMGEYDESAIAIE